MSDPRISRAVPLEQLRQPETDVRERRPADAVKSLAASMGDPAVGQLQDVLVHPVDYDDVLEERTVDELDGLFRDGHEMRIVDGETRRLAAEHLGWATLDATIVPEPPEETVVAQLDANTERVAMTEFETVRALFDYYQETEATLADVGAKVGYSESYLSNVFGLFDMPEFVVEAWRHPDHSLGTSHAIAVKSLLSKQSIGRYMEAGGVDEEEAHELALEDARLMVDNQQKYDLGVGDFRDRCSRCQKETLDQLKDDQTLDERRADGQARSAEQQDTGPAPEAPDPCTVCDADRPNRRKYALEVCHECYGMLSAAEANGETLMQPGGTVDGLSQETAAGGTTPSAAHTELFEMLRSFSPDEAQAVLNELQDVPQRPEAQTDD